MEMKRCRGDGGGMQVKGGGGVNGELKVNGQVRVNGELLVNAGQVKIRAEGWGNRGEAPTDTGRGRSGRCREGCGSAPRPPVGGGR